ncbi:hypothetical protein KP509_01G052300 [Ceratopteris richardii]|nr:hypothetical protein KP509_01G052300 [Ceratopteris richardii]
MRIHRRDRAKVMSEYIPHVISNAKALESDRRERKLYTNAKSTGWWSYRKVWESIPFQHPSTFSTLALDPILKQKIIDDLTEFKNGEQFYKEAGRAWKRGYLLYGPPGTGKSSMIACMANLLEYDVYDLELTEVRSNADLRNLLLNIGNKAIVVIEDIDCTLNLSERREKRKKDESQAQPGRGSEDKDQDENNKLTMSGLLNFIDGLWSSCVSERIFVFTTNHIEKLDAALIRSGRMDMHIHLSFCGFEAFKVLAKNYLKLKDHALFEEVRAVMEEDGVCMTPADITEVLTRERRDAEQALICLIEGLKASKINKKVQEMSEQKSRQGKESLEEDEVTEEKKQIEPAATRSDESGKKVEAEGQASENGMPSTKEELHAQVKDP